MKRFFAAFLTFALLFSNLIALADDEIGEKEIGGAEIINELNEMMQSEIPDFWFYKNDDGEVGVNLWLDENTRIFVPRENVEIYPIVDVTELDSVEKQQQFRDGYAEAQSEGIIHYCIWLDLPDEYAHYIKEPEAGTDPYLELYVTLHNGSVGTFKINGVPQQLTKRDDIEDVYGINVRDLGTTVMTVVPSESLGDASGESEEFETRDVWVPSFSQYVLVEERFSKTVPEFVEYETGGGGHMAEICKTEELKADNFDDENQEDLIVLIPYSDIHGTSIGDAGELKDEEREKFLEAFLDALQSDENVVFCFWLDLGSGFDKYINEEGAEEEPYLKLMLRVKGDVKAITVNGNEVPFEPVEGSPDIVLVRFTEMGAVTITTK